MDYSVTMGPLIMRGVPVTVNVTLLSDGVGGEGSEDILLTLVQRPPFEDNRVLVNPTIRITIRDNDSMYSLWVQLYRRNISERKQVPATLLCMHARTLSFLCSIRFCSISLEC